MPGRAGEGAGEEGFALNELQSGSSEQRKKKRMRRLILCGNNEMGTYLFFYKRWNSVKLISRDYYILKNFVILLSSCTSFSADSKGEKI